MDFSSRSAINMNHGPEPVTLCLDSTSSTSDEDSLLAFGEEAKTYSVLLSPEVILPQETGLSDLDQPLDLSPGPPPGIISPPPEFSDLSPHTSMHIFDQPQKIPDATTLWEQNSNKQPMATHGKDFWEYNDNRPPIGSQALAELSSNPASPPLVFPPSPPASVSSSSGDSLTSEFQKPKKRIKYEPVLPPCQVCSDKASGYHYGANTCEACKAFFRRALHRKTKFKCTTGGKCDLRQGRGYSCAYCRFQRCKQLGMALTAIKRGRYTHAKKAENIRAVKKLHEARQFEEQTGQNFFTKLRQKPPEALSDLMPGRKSPGDTLRDTLLCELASTRSNDIAAHTLAFNNPNNPETLITEINESHNKVFGDFNEMRYRLPLLEAQYLERRHERERNTGNLDHSDIWKERGIDINDRQDIMVEKILPSIQEVITKLIEFARSLPGFSLLSCDDQVALIKASRTDTWFIGEHKCYNTREGLYTSSVRRETIDKNEMSRIAGNPEVVQTIFKIVTRLQNCCLTNDEVVLYKAIAIMQRDRVTTQEGASICEQSQNRLMGALQCLLTKNHPDDPTLLARLLLILTDLRSMGKQRSEELAKMCMINMNENFPPAALQCTELSLRE